MASSEPNQTQTELDFKAFIRSLMDNAAEIRAPELFVSHHADALYQMPERHGISVVAFRTASLTQNEVIKILTYRLAQYVAINFVDLEMVYNARMQHEPLSNVAPDEVHIIAGLSGTGEILCYATLKGTVTAPMGTTLAGADRSLFPVEELFGKGVYNRLKRLSDLPVAKVRELGRFVKNQRKGPLDEFVFRATVELTFAICQILIGPLQREVDAVIGDIEEGVAKKNMDFFHVPLVVIHGVIPHVNEEAYLRPHVESSCVYPFAALVSDLSNTVNRLTAVEEALNLPGKQGVQALLALKADVRCTRSTLEPPEGLPTLTDARVPQLGMAMEARRHLLDVGNYLRTTSLFSGLSVAEAAVLGTFMERRFAVSGEAIIREGNLGDELYLIESGQAEVWIGHRTGRPLMVARLGAGDYFGEIALMTGEERTADVVAITPMTLLRLSKDAYSRYLAHLLEVASQLACTAVTRTHRTIRMNASGDP